MHVSPKMLGFVSGMVVSANPLEHKEITHTTQNYLIGFPVAFHKT